MYEIRLCKASEIEKLKDFIDTVWKKNHILSRDENILRWQHFNDAQDSFNFVVAYNTESDKFDAIMGFIPLQHFDKSLQANNNFWLALWKTDEINAKRKGLGADLLLYFQKKYNPSSIGVVGINSVVEKIYRIIGFQTGVMNHYYLINPELTQFKIAKVNNINKNISEKTNYVIKQLVNINEISDLQIKQHPHKSKEYFINRFLKHPTYKYTFYGVFSQEQLSLVLVTRKININNSSCIRVVDIIGSIKSLTSIETELIKLLKYEDAEYIDCYNYGIPDKYFINLGFKKRDDAVIIPNYFEPFEQRNVDIKFAYKSCSDNYIIFKGDGDQDRPS